MSADISLFIGISISLLVIIIINLLSKKYDKDRKETLQYNIIDFKKACEQKNNKEIDRLGKRIVNNPFLTMNIFRDILVTFDNYQKKFNPPSKLFINFNAAITMRRHNWGLYAHRYSDPEEYQKAKKDIVNFLE